MHSEALELPLVDIIKLVPAILPPYVARKPFADSPVDIMLVPVKCTIPPFVATTAFPPFAVVVIFPNVIFNFPF